MCFTILSFGKDKSIRIKMNINNVYLIGFMASGKSSFGKKLARHLDMDFFDLDSFIEEQEEMTIDEIFAVKGESFFRFLESEVLKNVSLKNTLISLGGGTPCSDRNIDFIRNNGLVIYLELPLKIIIGRLKQDRENRPIVKGLNDDELTEKIRQLFNSRETYYQEAHLTLDMQKSLRELKETVDNIIETNSL